MTLESADKVARPQIPKSHPTVARGAREDMTVQRESVHGSRVEGERIEVSMRSRPGINADCRVL